MAGYYGKKYDAGTDTTHAFIEKRDLHPLDIRLRHQGYRIHARPKGQEAVWTDGKELWTESELARLMAMEEMACQKQKKG